MCVGVFACVCVLRVSLFDIQLISTLGFDEDQLNTIKNIKGVKSVEGVHSIDAMCNLNHERYVMRVQDFDLDSAIDSVWLKNKVEVQSDNDNYLNRLVVEEGRFPTKDDECVLSADRIMDDSIKIGDEVDRVVAPVRLLVGGEGWVGGWVGGGGSEKGLGRLGDPRILLTVSHGELLLEPGLEGVDGRRGLLGGGASRKRGEVLDGVGDHQRP